MKIHGSLPMNVARAYGVRPATQPPPARAVAEPRTEPAAHVTPASGTPSVGRSPSLDKLVAATVDQPIDFASATPGDVTGRYQLYSRAADKIEASVAVMVGRSLDVRG